MRLLVLDGSPILASLVRRLAPEPFEIEEVRTFEEAMQRLREDPPDAAIVEVTPADLPWRSIKTFCRNHDPKIPVLFESCIHDGPIDAGIGNLNHSATFLRKPYDLPQFRAELERLFAASREIRGTAARDVLRPPDPPR